MKLKYLIPEMEENVFLVTNERPVRRWEEVQRSVVLGDQWRWTGIICTINVQIH